MASFTQLHLMRGNTSVACASTWVGPPLAGVSSPLVGTDPSRLGIFTVSPYVGTLGIGLSPKVRCRGDTGRDMNGKNLESLRYACCRPEVIKL
jgi:hypothetical protein